MKNLTTTKVTPYVPATSADGNKPVENAGGNAAPPIRASAASVHESAQNEEDRAWIVWLNERITSTLNLSPNDQVSRAQFKHILGVERPYEHFADRVFDMIRSPAAVDSVSVGDMMRRLDAIANMSTAQQKLQFVFDLYDSDASGAIDRHEFALVIETLVDAQSLALSPEQIAFMSNALFDEIDTDRSNTISKDELHEALDARRSGDDVFGSLQLSASRLIRPPDWKPPTPQLSHSNADGRSGKKMALTARWRWHTAERRWLSAYVVAVVGAYVYGALDALKPYHIEERGMSTVGCVPWYAIAHGFGFNLNWNVALLLVLMLRRSLTALRNSPIGWLFALDSTVDAHIIVGGVTGVLACGHVGAHLVHFNCLAADPNVNATYVELLFTPNVNLGSPLITGYLSLSGWTLLLFHAVMLVGSLPFIRRSGHFEVFFYSHLLYVAYFLILVLLHSDKFWLFLLVPGTIFLVEKLSMARCVHERRIGGEMYISDAALWKDVTQLTIARPPNFTFKAGDYIFLNVPLVAHFEWHPFTISSAPERSNTLTVHVRRLGGWTKRLHALMENHARTVGGVQLTGEQAKESLATVGLTQRSTPDVAAELADGRRRAFAGRVISFIHLPVNVDGPYGSASSGIFRAERAVLVCAGIGVTPSASILQSIVYRLHASAVTCPRCDTKFATERLGTNGDSGMRLRKLDFVWVVRDNSSVEWFLDLLDSIEQSKLIGVQIYVTSARRQADLASFAFVSALDVVHRKTQRCALTGLRNRARAGRPNWRKFFGDMATQEERVTVFFCGPTALGRVVRAEAERCRFRFLNETF